MNTLRARAGSDLSYDLIVEVHDCAPENVGIELACAEATQSERAQRIFTSLSPKLYEAVGPLSARIVFRLFARIPDSFVWFGRLEAALEAAQLEEKTS